MVVTWALSLLIVVVGDPHVLVKVSFIYLLNGRDPGTETAHRGWRPYGPE
jgi:hypothetical protein